MPNKKGIRLDRGGRLSMGMGLGSLGFGLSVPAESLCEQDPTDPVFLEQLGGHYENRATYDHPYFTQNTGLFGEKLTITELTGPLSADSLSTISLDNPVSHGFDADSGFLVVGDNGAGVPNWRYFDVSDLTNPIEVDGDDTMNVTGGSTFGKAVVDGDVEIAYLPADGVTTVDYSDKTNVTQLDTVSVGSINLYRHGDLMSVGGGSSITLVDISDPNNLVELGSATPGSVNYDIWDTKIGPNGDYAFAVEGGAGIVTAYDITDPNNLVQVSRVTATVEGESLGGFTEPYEVDSRWYMAQAGQDIYPIWDITDPTNLNIAGSISVGRATADTFINKDTGIKYWGSNAGLDMVC